MGRQLSLANLPERPIPLSSALHWVAQKNGCVSKVVDGPPCLDCGNQTHCVCLPGPLGSKEHAGGHCVQPQAMLASPSVIRVCICACLCGVAAQVTEVGVQW